MHRSCGRNKVEHVFGGETMGHDVVDVSGREPSHTRYHRELLILLLVKMSVGLKNRQIFFRIPDHVIRGFRLQSFGFVSEEKQIPSESKVLFVLSANVSRNQTLDEVSQAK